MSLGSPITTKTTIGTFELRLGPLGQAGRLKASQSVGMIDQVKLDIQMDTTELLTGFPQQVADVGITRQITGITATLRESSARNLNVMLGNGIVLDANDSSLEATAQTDWRATVTNNSGTRTTGQRSIPFTAAKGTFGSTSLNPYVVVYAKNNPGRMTIARVTGISFSSGSDGTDNAAGTLTLESVSTGKEGLIEGFDALDDIRVYKARTISAGDTDGTPKYFSAQLLRLDRGTSRPIGFNFWKTTISTGMSMSATAADFASFELQLKALTPTDADLVSGGSLNHMATTIRTNNYRVCQMFDVTDTTLD